MALFLISRFLRKDCWPASRSGRKHYRRPSPVRPRIEALEDRQVPTVSFFGGSLLPHVQAQALFLGNEFSPAPIVRVATPPAADSGFAWADAGIGAGLAAALLLSAEPFRQSGICQS